MDTFFCTQCGSKLESDDIFCPECGHPVERPDDPTPAPPYGYTPTYTPPVYTPPPYTPPPYTPPKRRSGKLAWILAASILVVCMLAGVVVAVLVSDDSSRSSTRRDDADDQDGGYSQEFSVMYSEASLPSQPEFQWDDHLYLRYKDMGYCESLTGNVVITFVFVSDPWNAWSGSTLSAAQDSLYHEISSLSSDAAEYGVPLTVSYLFMEADVSIQTTYDNDLDWSEQAAEDLGYDSVDTIQRSVEEENDADAAPIVFVLPKGGRAYAYPAEVVYDYEFAVLYQDDLTAFRHELFHLFGAEDYYYPEDVEAAAIQYLPNSIMWDSAGELDDFTAYCIGWRADLSYAATAFLEATAHITMEDIEAAVEEEQFTGKGRVDFDGGYYEGDLVMGVPHGYGKYVFSDGSYYQGEVDNGYFCGYGVYHYSNGDHYEGEFLNDEFHGRGTMYFADGDVWSGMWENGEFLG